jgi:hypothetical protein
MKMDLLDSIGREYDWVLQTIAHPGEARRSRDIPPEK